MLVVVDTDIINKFSREVDSSELRTNLRKHSIQITVPETVVKEVLVTSDPNVRAVLATTLIDLLGDFPPLASVPYQIKWGVQPFLDGEGAFKPFRCDSPDSIKAMLRHAKSLQNNQLELIRRELADAVNGWDKMHDRGRPKMQEILRISKEIPDAGKWMMYFRDSGFTQELVLGTVSDLKEHKKLKPRILEYIGWNPVCRCFIEQMMLAIRRHGLEHQSHSSNKGPKWADYFISAFVGITDLFVTDDSRLRRALEQHRCLRSLISWELRSLIEFIGYLQNDQILDSITKRTLETWPAVRE